MKIKSNFQKHRQNLLLLILGLSFSSIFFQFALGKVLWEACISKVILLSGLSLDNTSQAYIKSSGYLGYFIVLSLLVILFLTNASIALIKLVSSVVHTTRYVNSLRVVNEVSKVKIFKSRKKEVFTAGFLKPQVYMSAALYKSLEKEEYNFIISHEEAHVRNLDNLFKVSLNFLGHLALINLPLKFIFNKFTLLTEIIADENASENEKSNFSLGAIMKVIEQPKFNLSGFSQIAERVEIVFGGARLKVNTEIIYGIIFSIVFIISGTLLTLW